MATNNYNPNTSNYGTNVNPVTGQSTPGVTYNAPDAQNPYGSYTTGSGSSTLPSNQGNSTPPVIPVGVATGNVPPLPLPNTPQSQEATNLYSSAASYLSGAGNPLAALDQTAQQIQDLPTLLSQQFGIEAKQAKANEAQKKLDLFNEQFRIAEERTRTNPAIGMDIANARLAEQERKRAFGAGTLAIEAAAANNDLKGAKELMNQQMELTLEPLKMRMEFFKDLYKQTEDRKFQKQMRDEERAYQAERERLQNENDLKLSAFGVMSPKQAAAFVKDTTAQKASARAGVIQAVQAYNDLLTKYKGPGGLDFNRLTRAEKAELQSALNTTVGSAINVAQGQGAMGDQEAKRILGELEPSRWTRTKVFNAAASGVINAQRDLLRNDLNFLNVSYPGVYNMPNFLAALPDSDFFNSSSQGGAMVPVANYYSGI